jgi:hypothetical protein
MAVFVNIDEIAASTVTVTTMSKTSSPDEPHTSFSISQASLVRLLGFIHSWKSG